MRITPPPPISLIALLATLLSLFADRPAWATCPTSPVNWNNYDCDVGWANDVCTTTGSTYTCDVSAASEDATVFVVSNYGAGDGKVQAWGDADGEYFCCESGPNDDITAVVIEGSDYADSLSFGWATGTHYLHYTPAWGSNITTGTINGNGSNDVIHGSAEASVYYRDWLYGNAGADTIEGHAGDDYIRGGDGADILIGGAGGDTMYGDAGADVMRGDGGNDVMFGGADGDRMGGGGDNDTMDGGTGGDVMCGDGESGAGGDWLDDGDTDDETYPDLLWGANGSDDDTCQADSTKWDTWATPHGCSDNPTLSSKPAACP